MTTKSNPFNNTEKEVFMSAIKNDLPKLSKEIKNKPSFMLKAFAVFVALEFTVLVTVMIINLIK